MARVRIGALVTDDMSKTEVSRICGTSVKRYLNHGNGWATFRAKRTTKK